MSEWSVYLLRCSDNSLYTGIATDVSRRVMEHEAGKVGAKYLRGRAPYTLVYHQVVGNRSCAARVEHHIKRLTKREKESFVRSPVQFRSHIHAISEA